MRQKIVTFACATVAHILMGGEFTPTVKPRKDAPYMLICSNQGLTALPHFNRGDAPLITEIDAHSNAITNLPDDTLTALTALVRLDLSRNPITTVAPTAFCNNPTLQELNLRDHRIATFPRQLFCKLFSLSWLDLTTEKSMSLPHGIFHDQSSSLKHLLLASKVIFDWETNKYKSGPCAESLFTHKKTEAQSPDEIPVIVSFTGNRLKPELVLEFLYHCFDQWTGAASCSSPFAALQPVCRKSYRCRGRPDTASRSPQ